MKEQSHNKNIRNIFYASSQKYSVELSKLLYKRYRWKPVYWLIDRKDEAYLHSLYPKLITHAYLDSVKGKFSPQIDTNTFPPLDPLLLDKLALNQIIAMNMMDRNDSHSDDFLFRDRSAFYHRMLNYWFGVVQKYKIELIIFEEEPHQASDYILYSLCCEIGVKTFMMMRTISNLGLLPIEKFEDGNLELQQKYINQKDDFSVKDIHLDKNLESYFAKLQGTYDEILKDHLWDQVDQVKSLMGRNQKQSILSKITKNNYKLTNLKKYFHRLKLLSGLHPFENDLKQKRKNIEDSKQSYLEFTWYKTCTKIRKRRNAKIYDSVSSIDVDLNSNYIYCGLQYQPEKSTCPIGGHFVDQLLMVRLIAAYLPEGWNLFVKEHPSQFVSNYTRYGDFFRGKKFYDKLLDISNVKIVSLKFDSFKLIDHAKAVASVGGSLCWESVARGVPALCFGHSWYKSCEGIFEILSGASLKFSLNMVEGGFKIDVNKVKLFAKLLNDISFKGFVGKVDQEHKGISDEENAYFHLNAIEKLFINS